MEWSDISFRPSSRLLRQFAGLWVVFFGLLAWWQGWGKDRPAVGVGLATVALTVGLLGLAKPQAVRRVYVGWMVLAFPIGWTVSRLVLGVVFYGVFTPVALLFRLIGRDALQLRQRPEQESYWTPKPQRPDVRDYFRQY